MVQIDTRPQTVDITHYAGDTLSIRVLVPDALVAGREWSAQVRANRETGPVDATFTIVPITGGVTLVLPSAVTRSLGSTGVRVRAAKGAVLRYSGEWDVQLAPAGGGDPVTTVAQGSLKIDLDVTRSDP